MEKENPTNKLENIDLLSLNDLYKIDQNVSFYVANYQRGYRWESVQVTQLLNDIHENPNGKTYCLQPIMLTKKEGINYSFEVIDGQQRLTTLYIILKVLNKRGGEFHLPYSIDYATRTSCIQFLKNIEKHSFITENNPIENNWNNAVQEQDKNVDNFYIYNTYQTIFLWLENKKINEIEFLQKITNDIKLIWHPVEVSESSNAKKLFRNINSGKIRLTSSDLIKALFVLDFQKKNLPWHQRNQLKTEFANQWNEIEKQLNQDRFWFFINNGENENYSTRIALLFDLVTKNTESTDKYASYLKYAEGAEPLHWEKIVDIFRKIHEWFVDEKYYHRIGFLVNSKKMSFSKIVDLYNANKTKPKSVFYEELNKIVDNCKPSNIHTINYKDDRFTCKNVLLLYNILIFEKDFPKQKFPFDMYVNEEWSLEHIHPQNPQDFTKIEDAIFWLEDTKKTLEQKNKSKEEKLPVLEKIEQFVNDAKGVNATYNKERKEKIREIKDLLETEAETHKLKNLVLLDKTTNSKLGNGLFKNKREIILKIDGKDDGNFVPYATVNCFLKRHTNKENLQNEFWSDADAEGYSTNLKTVIYGK